MLRYTPMADLREFHSTFAPEQRTDDLLDKITRRMELVKEEFEEAIDALYCLYQTDLMYTSLSVEDAREELAKELADLLYVVYGTAEELDLPLEEVFRAIHQSNMSKAESDGTVKRNKLGKIMKPTTYTPPDLSFIHDDRFLP